jgi:hypothetical protein
MSPPPTPRSPRAARALAALAGAALLALAAVVFAGGTTAFLLGGALIDLGYRVQDPVRGPEHASASAVWAEVLAHNGLAARVRRRFPRTTHHPLVAMVVCMDARLDTNELVGDTRRYFYVLRLAGSVMSEREEEMLELAVDHGVEVVVLTTHTECAAEHVAADPALRARYPHLAAGVDEREARRAEFLARPAIAERIRDGRLRVEHRRIDTATGALLPEVTPGR